MKRCDIITAIMASIDYLVKEAYFERNKNPNKFKLRNHYISEALGLHHSLCILRAYPIGVLERLKSAIENYDIYTVHYISNSEKIRPYKYNSKM